MTKLIEAFNRWFSSKAGVYQTFAVSIGWVIWEQLHPNADPHGFWLLYVFTVWSGVTQNLLAYGNGRTAQRTDTILDSLEHMVSDEFVVDRRTYELVKRVASKLGCETDD